MLMRDFDNEMCSRTDTLHNKYKIRNRAVNDTRKTLNTVECFWELIVDDKSSIKSHLMSMTMVNNDQRQSWLQYEVRLFFTLLETTLRTSFP